MATREEILDKFRGKYNELFMVFPQIGNLEAGRLSKYGEMTILDFPGNAMASLVLNSNNQVVEVHGGIYLRWKKEGGEHGPLGLPVKDEDVYLGADARPGDRVSKFENGYIIYRADIQETEVRTGSELGGTQDKASYIWHDEFDGSVIDESKWSFEIGTGSNGWGNNEKQYYTARRENAYVKDGFLHIRATKENYGRASYTSARMITKGKFSLRYGTIEARIALPSGLGIWPAFWMLGVDIDKVGWPACGEIDILEAVNAEQIIYGTTHWQYNGSHAHYGNSTSNFHGAIKVLDVTKFHTYKCTWDEKYIAMYVDGFKYHEILIQNDAGGTGAFHKPFYFLLNVAVGGNWPGFYIDDSQFPNEMLVDYIRISTR